MKEPVLNPNVNIELNGENYILCFPLPAIWKLEDLTGLQIIGGLTEDQQKKLESMTPRENQQFMVRQLYAGLITHHPELDENTVGSMVFAANLDYIQAKVMEALAAAKPQPKATEGGDDPLAQKGSQNGSPEKTSGPALVSTSA
jgi:hypothetical protein